jgi:L-amino acid N-acyltransferase YncA
MATNFRYAGWQDLEKVVSTYNAAIPSRLVTADLEPVSVESRTRWFNDHNQTSRPLWIIDFDDKYAGWMSFNSFYGRPAYSGTVEVSIYLEPTFQGKGIGRECLRKAIEEAPAMEIHTLLGFIFGHNGPSIALFKKFGFEEWAHLPQVANMDGVFRDLLIYGRKLAR